MSFLKIMKSVESYGMHQYEVMVRIDNMHKLLLGPCILGNGNCYWSLLVNSD